MNHFQKYRTNFFRVHLTYLNCLDASIYEGNWIPTFKNLYYMRNLQWK